MRFNQLGSISRIQKWLAELILDVTMQVFDISRGLVPLVLVHAHVLVDGDAQCVLKSSTQVTQKSGKLCYNFKTTLHMTHHISSSSIHSSPIDGFNTGLLK